jgi:hypothetical protein
VKRAILILILFLFLSACSRALVTRPLSDPLKISKNGIIEVDHPYFGECLKEALEDKFDIPVIYSEDYTPIDKEKINPNPHYLITTEYTDVSKRLKDYKGLTGGGSGGWSHFGEGGGMYCWIGCLGLGLINKEKRLFVTIYNLKKIRNWDQQSIEISGKGSLTFIGVILPIPVYIPLTIKSATCEEMAEEIASRIEIFNPSNLNE